METVKIDPIPPVEETNQALDTSQTAKKARTERQNEALAKANAARKLKIEQKRVEAINEMKEEVKSEYNEQETKSVAEVAALRRELAEFMAEMKNKSKPVEKPKKEKVVLKKEVQSDSEASNSEDASSEECSDEEKKLVKVKNKKVNIRKINGKFIQKKPTQRLSTERIPHNNPVFGNYKNIRFF